jgi:stage IV sporulation protein FB
VLFAEPPHTQYDLHFRLAGFNVRVHPFFWLGTILLGINPRTTAIEVLLWVFTVFVSILVHEMGHALAFRYYGKRSHIVLHGFGGLAIPEAEYDIYNRPSRGEDHMSQIIIALAGPAAGFLLAAVVALIVQATGHRVEMNGIFVRITPLFENRNAGELVGDLLSVNIYWGLMNLLPVFPLDGGRVAREILEMFSPHNGLRQSLILSCAAGVGVAVVAAVRLQEIWLAIMFGYLAFMSYQMLQQVSGGGSGGSEW